MNRKQIEESNKYYREFNQAVRKEGLLLNHADFRKPVIAEKPPFWQRLFGAYDNQHPHFVAIINSDAERGRLPTTNGIGYSLKEKILGYNREFDGLEISLLDSNYEDEIADIVSHMEFFLNEHVNILYPGYQGVPTIESQIAIANQHPKKGHNVDYSPEALNKIPHFKGIEQLQF